jgi:hypothetical protein
MYTSGSPDEGVALEGDSKAAGLTPKNPVFRIVDPDKSWFFDL